MPREEIEQRRIAWTARIERHLYTPAELALLRAGLSLIAALDQERADAEILIAEAYARGQREAELRGVGLVGVSR